MTTKPMPDLQRRHFVALAGIIRELPASMREAVAEHFAARLAGTNRNFDRERFMLACLAGWDV